MLNNIKEIEKRIKRETNNIDDIIYRKKTIGKTNILIIFNEPLTSADKISNFIIRSLNNIDKNDVVHNIENNINNFKWKRITTYEEICFFLHRGFTIILIEDNNYALVLETKANLNRGISFPEGENTLRGAKDSFVEEFQINIGLIKKRIKTNSLRIDKLTIGKYTNTQFGVLSIDGKVDQNTLDVVNQKLKDINIDGVVNLGTIKNLLIDEERSVFPIIQTSERPDVVSQKLVEGQIVVVMDNTPYALIIPSVINDFFITMEDSYGNYKNVTFTRIIKYIALFISLMAPAIYVALVTYNMEIIPSNLLINIANQREGVPFPVPIEVFIMLMAFEILRESDLRSSKFSGSSLSIVGALILGESAVSAGIVSPITIIIIALTAISSILFTELDFINALRLYRLLFLVGATTMGLIGVLIVLLYFIINLLSLNSFGKPYLMPFVPTNFKNLKNSIFRAKERNLV